MFVPELVLVKRHQHARNSHLARVAHAVVVGVKEDNP